MSSIVRPPDPCLVAIILIVRSRAGPRFVFHYPPNPLSDNGLRTTPGKGRRASRAKSRQGTKSNDSSSTDEDSSLSDEDDDESHLTGSGLSMTRRMSNFGVDDHQHYSNVAASPMTTGSGIGIGDGSHSQQRPGSLGSGRMLFRKRDVDEQSGTTGGGAASERQDEGSAGPFSPPWESLLGLPADVWEKLLSPTRSWHKRRFEVGINDLAFVGWPVFVREDGTWRKQKRKKDKRRSYTDGGKEGGDLSHNDSTDDGAGHEESIDAMVDSADTLSPRVLASPDLKRTSGLSEKMLRASTESLDGDDKDSMTMFNVVFVVDPPLLEYSIRTRNLYDNVIKKLSKALKWEQGRTDYVWREAQHISHLKDKAREKSTPSRPFNQISK